MRPASVARDSLWHVAVGVAKFPRRALSDLALLWYADHGERGLMADVFISYKKEEREKAHAIAVALEALSVSTWLDAQLSPGQSFTEEIREELARCKAQLVCWSKAAIRSE